MICYFGPEVVNFRFNILASGGCTVTNAGSLYYTANVDETTEKGLCVAMML